ncbi:hypothetical protein D3Z52_08515 [Clostridiaceae bacterium]|nr:hypothetical protein [Clostridiaceae bacterium]
MKWVLLLTFVFYVFLLFSPMFTVKINGKRSDVLWHRIIGAFVLTAIFFVFVGLPLFGIISLFI